MLLLQLIFWGADVLLVVFCVMALARLVAYQRRVNCGGMKGIQLCHMYSILKLSSYFYEDGLVVYAFTNTLDLSSLTSPYMVLPPAKRL